MTENQQASRSEISNKTEDVQKADDKIRFRAILIGSILALAICLLTPFNNAYRQGTPLGGGTFSISPVLHLGVDDVFNGLDPHHIQRP